MVSKTRLEKTKEIIDDASQIMDKLNMIAADDGILNNDEVDLINVIEECIRKYRKLLNEVMEDDMVNDKELQRMKEMEIRITEIVQNQAIADGKISVSESELIDALFDCLKSFNTVESF